MSTTKIGLVILAAGLGTRMKSDTPKVLHELFDRSMLSHVLDAATPLKPARTIVVLNDQIKSTVSESLSADTLIAIQKKQHGTGDALKSALPHLKTFKGTILVTNGDTPLITPATLKKFITRHKKSGNKISLLSFSATDPHGYGRIIRGNKKTLEAIVEEKDASAEQRYINEVNSGVYAIEPSALILLKKIKKNPLKGEYYLTDIVALALKAGMKVGALPIGDEDEFMGVNSRRDLVVAHEIMRTRTVDAMIDKGVTFIDTFTAYIGPDVKIGRDTIIYPNVYIHGNCTIGKGCRIYPGVRIMDCKIADGAIIKDSSMLEQSTIGKGAKIGPMAHLRPESKIGANAKVGNFVEIKKTTIGAGAKASHLSYLGDATIGEDANIGAGTITCNYDGKNKFPTAIGKGVFIGSDTQLVAPVNIGDGAYIGAGSTITRDVEPGSLAVSRTKQKNIKRRKMKS